MNVCANENVKRSKLYAKPKGIAFAIMTKLKFSLYQEEVNSIKIF